MHPYFQAWAESLVKPKLRSERGYAFMVMNNNPQSPLTPSSSPTAAAVFNSKKLHSDAFEVHASHQDALSFKGRGMLKYHLRII